MKINKGGWECGSSGRVLAEALSSIPVLPKTEVGDVACFGLECLPGMHEALGLIPNPEINTKNKQTNK
jgi:hypothetical protein